MSARVPINPAVTLAPLNAVPITSALEVALVRLRVLADELLNTLPSTAIVVFDDELRLRLMAGSVWKEDGREPSEQVGRPVAEVFDGPIGTRVIPEYRAVLDGHERSFTLTSSPQHIRWITARPICDDDGIVVGGVAVSWDGSRAREAEEQYRLLAENATDVVSRHDHLGRFLYVSPSIEALAGWSPAELLHRPVLELIHPDDQAAVATELEALRQDQRVTTLTYRMQCRDGRYAWQETTARVVDDARGAGISELQCSTRDITERRTTELELARRLAQQSAVAKLGKLALRRPDVDALQEEACRLVSETLDVELVYALEHVEGADMRVRAGFGWPEGFVGSEIEVSSFGRGAVPGNFYAGGAVVVDDLAKSSMRARPLRANGVVSCAWS